MYKKIMQLIGCLCMVLSLIFNIFIKYVISPDNNIQSITTNVGVMIISILILFLGLLVYTKAEMLIQHINYLNPCWIYKNKKKEIILLCIVSLFCLSILEITARIIIPPKEITEYGWTTPANTTYTVEFDDSPNMTRNITVTYYDFGFKRWGDISTNKTKILIIGDSITSMHFVSNGEEWYAYLEKEFPDAEFFVYGCSGYGSVQEYMVVDDFVDIIKPNIIIWQFSGNDYINNLHRYELKNYAHNNRALRPYLENGQIVYKIPRPLGFLRQYSVFFNFLLEQYDSFVFKIKLAKIAYDPSLIRDLPEEKEDAYNVTVTIIQMISDRAGDVPVYLFSASPISLQEEIIFEEKLNLTEICEKTGITCIFGVAESVNQEEEDGEIVKVADGHWNTLGNKLAGEYLANYFRKNNVFN